MNISEISAPLLQHLSNIVIYTDPEGNIKYVNPEFEETTQYKQEEVIGSTARILKSGKQQKKFYTRLWDHIKSGKVYETTFINQKKNGNFYYQETKIIPVVKAKKITGFLSVGTNITESVRKVIFIDNLTKEVTALNKDFGTLLYKTSHNLRSPVANILGVLELVKLDIDDPKLVEYFSMISQSADKLDRILVDLIRLSIIRTSTVSQNPIDFNNLLDDIIRNLNKFYPVSKFTVTRSIQVNRLYKFEKIVLRNLLRPVLENAFQYRQYEPKKALNLEGKKHQVDIQIFEEGKFLVIRIKDNGIGINKQNQREIFDMFYKASDRSGGAGLGLFIAKSALQRMQGEIAVESSLGAGTSFTFYLPNDD